MKVMVLNGTQQAALATLVGNVATTFAAYQSAYTAWQTAKAALQNRIDGVTGSSGTEITDDGTALVNR